MSVSAGASTDGASSGGAVSLVSGGGATGGAPPIWESGTYGNVAFDRFERSSPAFMPCLLYTSDAADE